MNTTVAIFGIVAALLALSGYITTVIINTRAERDKAEMARIRADRDDYKGRVEFIEPRMADAVKRVEFLEQMVDPSARLDGIKTDTTAILAALHALALDLHDAQDIAGGEHG